MSESREHNEATWHDDPIFVDQLVGRLSQEYLSKSPSRAALAFTRINDRLFQLLANETNPENSPFWVATGRTSALIAHAYADLGMRYQSKSALDKAREVVRLSNDYALQGFVAWVGSNLSFWAGDYVEVIALTNEALAISPESREELRLLMQQARAWAGLRNVEMARKTLDAAEGSQERMLSPNHMSGVFDFDIGKAAYYASEVELSLGQDHNLRAAEHHAERSLTILSANDSGATRHEILAAARLDLALARLALREADGAVMEVETVLDLRQESRTKPIVARMQSARVALTELKAGRSDLIGQMDEFGKRRAIQPPVRRLF